MLKNIELCNVGPAERMAFKPVAHRFNLITGDNGLGKSFLLEASWWALTGTWHAHPAVPSRGDAVIAYQFDGDTKVYSASSKWDPKSQRWRRKAGRPPNPGLVIYAGIDGSFSIWDPARNYRIYRRADGGEAESPAAYQFGPHQVLDGLRRTVVEGGVSREQVVCAGLIDDWTRWQAANDPKFQLLTRLLHHLGPDGQPLEPGRPVRPTLDDDLRSRIETTIRDLRLNEDPTFIRAREEYHDLYHGLQTNESGVPREPLPFDWLANECPFVAYELQRQGRLRK
ncbi:AAA family ATPase [Sulfidibacter corallicola]|uniref:AAA family ATPase n=1 Tax=Sulfidibacter corallicola TaxID=2818388 RepID=A0A8A4TD27_SULCO|nr:AAA family ATPase [Sulfidibacter corallicola]QTD47573.1 AAA family ATPase [Sulfidibacter corallicola]